MLYFIVAESTCAGICCSVCVSSFLLHDQLEQQIHPFQPSGSFLARAGMAAVTWEENVHAI